tara:strand:+ start:123 stop:923 length:801 start_codon:yes stop_codon:yes gene_type:complete
MIYLSKIIFLLILFFTYPLTAQVSDIRYSTSNEEIIISIDSDSIATYAMLAAGTEKKETVILLHGLPGNERNLDLAQELRKNGFNVIYFNYRGAWGSQGEFSYANCLQDVSEVIDFFNKPENSEKYKIKTDSYILFGHSLGGGIALISGALDNRVKKIAVYSPFHIGTASDESLHWAYEYSKSLFMLELNPKKFYNELLTNKNIYNVVNYSKELLQKPLLILDENERNKIWIEKLKNVEYVLMQTDHSFSDKRSELITKVISWINN